MTSRLCRLLFHIAFSALLFSDERIAISLFSTNHDPGLAADLDPDLDPDVDSDFSFDTGPELAPNLADDLAPDPDPDLV